MMQGTTGTMVPLPELSKELCTRQAVLRTSKKRGAEANSKLAGDENEDRQQ